MSTLKADAVTSSQDNTALTLSGRGTGGVKVNDFFIQTKGADISSATSLTLGKDGNQFDVTGTTTITSIATQGIGSYVTLHFDGALTFTHHSTNLILPGAANITTAAGDIAVMYEYASADWRCVSYTKASGAAVVAGGGNQVLVSTVVASNDATIDILFTPGDADTFLLELAGVIPVTDEAIPWLRSTTDASTFDSGSNNYAYQIIAAAGSTVGGTNADDSEMVMAHNNFHVGTAAGESMSGWIRIHKPADTALFSMFTWLFGATNSTPDPTVVHGSGFRASAADIDGIQFFFSSGNIESGRFSLYKITHA
jgi:hypothetical protein